MVKIDETRSLLLLPEIWFNHSLLVLPPFKIIGQIRTVLWNLVKNIVLLILSQFSVYIVIVYPSIMCKNNIMVKIDETRQDLYFFFQKYGLTIVSWFFLLSRQLGKSEQFWEIWIKILLFLYYLIFLYI